MNILNLETDLFKCEDGSDFISKVDIVGVSLSPLDSIDGAVGLTRPREVIFGEHDLFWCFWCVTLLALSLVDCYGLVGPIWSRCRFHTTSPPKLPRD